MAKLDLRIKESGKESLILEKGGRSRLLYFIIFLFLSTTVILSIDFSYDFTSSRIGGTMFTFLLILISLVVTLTVKSFRIDKSTGLLCKNVGLPFGLYVKDLKVFRLGSVPRFIVRTAGIDNRQGVMDGNRFMQTAGTAMAKGRSKISLCLETEEDTVVLCEGASKEEILQVANYASAYLGFPVKTED